MMSEDANLDLEKKWRGVIQDLRESSLTIEEKLIHEIALFRNQVLTSGQSALVFLLRNLLYLSLNSNLLKILI